MKITIYGQAKDYLEQFITQMIFSVKKEAISVQKDPLKRMRVLLSLVDNPQEKFASVLVGGTSGKGSTAYLVSHILTTAGYKTGLTISPHLQKINERLQINNKAISNQRLVDLVNEVMPAIEKMKTMDIGVPSYFEILVTMAFLLFVKEKVDIAVVEVGLGGEFDATNVLEPLIAVITNVSLDHTEILGKTITKIAKAKAGIIKKYQISNFKVPRLSSKRAPSSAPISNNKKRPENPIVVTGVRQSSVIRVVEQRAKSVGTPLCRLGKDFLCIIHSQAKEGMGFDFIDKEKHISFKNLKLKMIGEHQVQNASLAIEIILQLQQLGFSLPEKAIRDALETAFFPGRFEMFMIHDLRFMNQVILDGAHNPEKMRAFITSLKTVFPKQKKIFLVAFKQDKDIEQMLKIIASSTDTIIFTKFNLTTDMQKKLATDLNRLKVQSAKVKVKKIINYYFLEDTEKAFKKAKKIAKQQQRMIIVTGSLYLVGEIRELL